MSPVEVGPDSEGVLPTFVVIGAMKAGTTSLYHYLDGHPAVGMPKIKELDFFVAEMNWPRGLGWYQKQFDSAESSVARGDVSTSYAKAPRYAGVPERMAEVIPGARLVYVVRDPVERMRSHYQHRVANGSESSPPELALLDNPIYVDYSRYAYQLEQYLEHFERDQILVITAEGLRDDRLATLARLYAFIGVDATYVPTNVDTEYYKTAMRRRYPSFVWAGRRWVKQRFPQAKRAKEFVDSVSSRSRPDADDAPKAVETDWPSPEARARIVDSIADDVARLRAFTGSDFGEWRL